MFSKLHIAIAPKPEKRKAWGKASAAIKSQAEPAADFMQPTFIHAPVDIWQQPAMPEVSFPAQDAPDARLLSSQYFKDEKAKAQRSNDRAVVIKIRDHAFEPPEGGLVLSKNYYPERFAS